MNVTSIMKQIKHIYADRIRIMIENEDPLAHNKIEDNTKIETILFISFSMKTFKLVIIITIISYFLGMLWYVLCEIELDFFEDYFEGGDQEMFQDYFNLREKRPGDISVITTYFAFTSLSTVGFGDFNPRSDVERLACAFVLFFGVAIFSYIMGNFIGILDSFKDFNAELDYGDELSKFFGTIKKFNRNEPIDLNLKRNIEAHFDNKWQSDKNQAFYEEHDLSIFNQLPGDVQILLYKDFLFSDFLDQFKNSFCFPKNDSCNQYAFYTWNDFAFRNFMIDILQALEPRLE